MIGRLAAFARRHRLAADRGAAQTGARSGRARARPDPDDARREPLWRRRRGRARQQIRRRCSPPPGACNPYLNECQAAAAAVAREFAPSFRQGERARAERITAYLLADTLRPEEMARIAQYLRGEEGGKLLGALALLRQPERTERRRRELDRLVPRGGLGSLDAALARFRHLTRNIPRAAPR